MSENHDSEEPGAALVGGELYQAWVRSLRDGTDSGRLGLMGFAWASVDSGTSRWDKQEGFLAAGNVKAMSLGKHCLPQDIARCKSIKSWIQQQLAADSVPWKKGKQDCLGFRDPHSVEDQE
jgi:hypothetical protein